MADDIRIATLEPGNAEAVSAMLGRCSAATLYDRFHGITDGVSHALQVLADASGHDAYGAWSADRCVGLASLALDGDGSAHIGVLVEDRWQRQGAGSALVAVLAGRARERRLPSLVAEVLAHNQFILPLLARIGPITTTVAYGRYTVRIILDGRTSRPGRTTVHPFDGREAMLTDELLAWWVPMTATTRSPSWPSSGASPRCTR